MVRALNASSRSVWGEGTAELLATNEGLAADEDFGSGFLIGEVYIGRKNDFPCNGEGARAVNANAAATLLIISASCNRALQVLRRTVCGALVWPVHDLMRDRVGHLIDVVGGYPSQKLTKYWLFVELIFGIGNSVA